METRQTLKGMKQRNGMKVGERYNMQFGAEMVAVIVAQVFNSGATSFTQVDGARGYLLSRTQIAKRLAGGQLVRVS